MFNSWLRELWRRDQEKAGARKRKDPGRSSSESASFALVDLNGEQGELSEAGIELVLAGGRRLRLGKGVDAQTLVSVVAALEAGQC